MDAAPQRARVRVAGDNARHSYFRRFGLYAYRHHIGPADDLYMRRWILRLPFGGSVRLHHIVRSDAGRELHDHPFDFVSWLLTGGYLEVRPDGSHWRRRWSLVRRRAEDLHRVVVVKPVWTFVITGPWRREWGFQTPTGWVSRKVYGGEP